ncbi:MAG: TatD family hydrolase [Prevotella sp.]|nr:TatD family hydrolase [Prevotella sp.]
MNYIDTHAHIDGQEFDQDRNEVIARAREAGAAAIFVPAIDLPSSCRILALCQQHPSYLYPMAGLHPEEVRADWRDVLSEIKKLIAPTSGTVGDASPLIAIGEVGLDFYWSREFEKEQLAAFEEQVQWSVETRLPLMIHCRKAQNEMVSIIKRYARELPGGVFHCFTGNAIEAEELLQFPQFVLGIGGVLTFKKSHLPEVLPAVVPLDRIVLETDAPYMAPVPLRGQRNEPAYVRHVIARMAQAYGVSEEEVATRTTANAKRVFHITNF